MDVRAEEWGQRNVTLAAKRDVTNSRLDLWDEQPPKNLTHSQRLQRLKLSISIRDDFTRHARVASGVGVLRRTPGNRLR